MKTKRQNPGATLIVNPADAGRRYTKFVVTGRRQHILPGIMSRRPSVISKKPDLQSLIGNRLGWVDIATQMQGQVSQIDSFGNAVVADGLNQVVVIGMGGSSLCPEVFMLIFGRRKGIKSIDILDSTDPAAINTVANRLDLHKSLFIVASKSGGTVETRSHESFFIEKCKAAGISEYGRHFTAITDPDSDLEKFARAHNYRQIFVNPADIGGRYSALSYFGLVPGWFAGIDVLKLMGSAISMQSILLTRNDESNPALALGAFMAACSVSGRDKLTFVAGPIIAPFVPWIEQLVAESTGKQLKGVVPIESEPVGAMREYGNDRAFVFLSMAGEKSAANDSLFRQCTKSKVPCVRITLSNKHQLGSQFLLWEAATAACGASLKINPFDEPNVTESKNNTQAILKAFQSSKVFPKQEPQRRWGKLSLVAVESRKRFKEADCTSLDCILRHFLKAEKPPKYLSILSYFESTRASEKAIAVLRSTIRKRTKLTTLRGYGPRFLHSIGQLYKGGPRTGLFIILVREKYENLPIPGQYFSFGDLISAQAIGDTQALVSRKLPVLVLAVSGNPASAIAQLEQSLKKAFTK